ncbi:hypothetical protein G5C66_10700 [Nocardioides sp. KC13]|uniref:Glycosyltransferase RgtA/B/C/D-like domain-containing protein n=2 Tax=Nocardioides turkmenicus TaxID=2711220 RepID=A0A6M1QTK6_9ACTN|nr:hypothetical protein [Nocardioides sp. KC13]NGN93203.1 hypothetical protein [Nocardioides sp. KC13]
MVAEQWQPGRSLYGDYWVDRPPLLLWLFTIAGYLGSVEATTSGLVAPGLKVLGAVAGGLSVALTGVLASLVSPGSRPTLLTTVVLAAALVSSPLLGMPAVNGELLAVPLVLLGLVCAVTAMRGPWGWRTAVLAAAAGASGMAAALVKQNFIDVFVFTAVLVAISHPHVPRLWARAATFAGGAAASLGAAVAGAGAQGTSVPELWDAVVVFRTHAADLIEASASSATAARGVQLVTASLGSGVAVVLVIAVAAVVARRSPLALPVLAMTAWELVAIAAGGSYWLHYLTGIVPGLVLLVATAGFDPARRSGLALRSAVAYAVVAALVVWTLVALAPPQQTPESRVSTYLREHAHPSDGVVVGFGHPEIIAASGLDSPYENLWSLPARVRDPHLTHLHSVLAGGSAPRWVVVDGDSLDTWGLDGDHAQQYLRRHYVERVSYDDWHIWQRRSTSVTVRR